MTPAISRFLLGVFLAVGLSVQAASGQAQSLFPDGDTAGVGTDPVDAQQGANRLIEAARELGLSIVVIDGQGSVLRSDAAPADTSLAPQSEAGLMAAQENAYAFRTALFDRLRDLPAALNELRFVLRASSPDGTIWAYVRVLLYSLGLFAVGMAFEKYVFGRRIAKHFIVPLIREDPQGYSGKMPFLAIRFIGGVIGTLVSMAVAYVLGYAIFGPIEDSAIQYTATLVNIGYFSARVIIGLWRMILSPYLPQYRIPMLTDREARRLHIWLSVVVSTGVFALLFATWIRELGLNRDIFVFIRSLTEFGVVLLNIVMVLVNRRAITKALLHGADPAEVSWPVRVLAGAWLPLSIFYLLFAWGELVYDLVLELPPGVPLGPGAYIVLTVVIVVYGLINFGIERSFARARSLRAFNLEAAHPDSEDVVRSPEAEAAVRLQRERITTFEQLARRVAGILAFVAGAWAFVEFWDPGTDMMSESLAARLLDIIVILFLGYIAYMAFRIWIDAKIAEEQGDEEAAELGDEGGGSSASRLATLLPLFRNVVLIVIVASVLLIVLMELGVNVGPLFAGAGIVGVAIGFGSQTLVRDIFSGAFFLFDDAFRKGEYVEIGDVKGTVEKISVRSFQLRHHLGKLHTIPFGEIQVLSNYSRDWVMMKLPLRVTYDTDVEHVRKIIKKLGQRLLEDPEIGPQFIQPLKSQGVIEMQDSAMILRVKFMTKPGDQWVIRKRVFQEIRDLFEQEGIKFAHREVTVRLADGDAARLDDKQREAVLAAAEAALEDEDMLEGPEREDDR